MSRAAVRAMLPVRRCVLRRRVGRLVLERVDGFELVVLPRVFHPTVFRSSTMLAAAIAALPAPPAGARALDMGTGSGIGALHAARRGYSVTAVDINPDAVRCTRVNALLNGLEDHIDAREGDLLAPVAGERFELVAFNPPFYHGAPRGPLDAAWRGDGVMERFAAGLPAALTRRGLCLLVLSTDGEPEYMLGALRRCGIEVEPVAERDFGNEVMTVYACRAAVPEAS